MKKIAASLLAALTLVGCAAAFAAGESLVSLGYLEKNVLPGWEQSAGERVEQGMASTYDQVVSGLRQRHQAVLNQLDGTGGVGLRELRLKKDDRVILEVGSGALLWSGQVVAEAGTAPAVDVTGGYELTAGGALSARHRYLAAGNGPTVLRVVNDAALLSVEGNCGVESSTATDYFALADALKAMGVFKGIGIEGAGGYMLEAGTDRLSGLVMFIRMMGEDAAALAYEGPNPFSDLSGWGERYGAYAYAKGYAKGYTGVDGKLCYGPYVPMGATEYMTIVLRALGYQDGGDSPDFQWNASLPAALNLRVLTPREHKQLTEQPFTRAQVVYLSYFNLSAQKKNGGTLLDNLVNSGSIDRQTAQSIMGGVTVPRM